MSPIALIVLYLGVGSTLAWLRHHDGARLTEIPWILVAWPLDFLFRCLAVLHELSPASAPAGAVAGRFRIELRPPEEWPSGLRYWS